MKRIIQISLMIAVLGLISTPSFSQAGTISYSNSWYIGPAIEWVVDVKEFKAVRFTYTADVFSGPPMVTIFELSADGVTYNSIGSFCGYTSGTMCTNLKNGKAKVVLYPYVYSKAVFNIQYSADNPMITNSDLNVGGNGTIKGNLIVNSSLSIPSTTVSNSIMGKLGIGTTSPSNNFEVVGSASTTADVAGFYNTYTYGNNINKAETRINIGKIGAGVRQPMGSIGAFPTTNDNSGEGNLVFYTRSLEQMYERLRIKNNGNVGIGTTTPEVKCQINNWANSTDFRTARQLVISGDNWGGLGHDQLGPAANKYGLEIGFHYIYGSEAVKGGRIQAYANGVTRLMLNPDGGNVSIGTTEVDPTGAMLTVKGKIHTNEIIIDVLAPIVPDFVFHPSYSLMPLHEVEQYVKTNSHLPEIPSAAEVSKNGMSIGEMQNKLLQKIEELTLYVIEQDKKIERLEKRQR